MLSRNKLLSFKPFFLFLLSMSIKLSAQDFFVSLYGNDKNPGTEAQPWRTIQRAANSATPGSTVYVKGGTYNEKIVISVQGNEKDGYITFRNFQNDKVVISGAGVPKKQVDHSDNIFFIKNKNYIKIIGFEIRDIKAEEGSGIRFWGSGHHIEIRNNIIHEIRGGGSSGGAMGITIYGSNNKEPIHDLIIDGNEIYNCDPAWSEALTLNGNIELFEVTNNKVHDVNNIGIDFVGGESWISNKAARNGICRGNIVYHARSPYEDGYAAGIYVDGGNNIIVENNEVFECDMGIEIGAENQGTVVTGIHVQNNHIHRNDKAGLVFGGYASSKGRVKNCIFTHNTLENNDTFKLGHGEIWIQFASDNLITHNTIKPNTQNIAVYSGKGNINNTLNYNDYYSSDIDRIIFVWKGKEYKGLSKFKSATGQESQATVNTGIHAQFSALKAPSHVTAKPISDKEIEVSWNDNSISETGFEVQHSIDNREFKSVKKVKKNVKCFRGKVSPDKQHYYRVKAYNSLGESNYSEVASATIDSNTSTVTLTCIQAENLYGDAYLEEAFKESKMIHVKGSSDPKAKIQANLYFVLDQDISLPPKTEVLSAELELYCEYVEKLNENSVQVSLLTGDDVNESLLSVQDIIKSNQAYKYDLTSYIADQVESGKSLIIFKLEADSDRLIQFHSHENSNLPRLTIHYRK